MLRFIRMWVRLLMAIVREIKKRNKSIICYIIIKKKENNCFPFFVSAHELCIYKKNVNCRNETGWLQ